MSASRKKACSRLAQDTAMVVKLCLVHRQAEIQRSHHRMLQAVQLLQTQAAYLGIRIVAQNVIIVPLRSEHQAGRGESVACLWTYGQCRVPLEHAIDVDKCDHIALVAATEVPAQPIHVALDGNIWNPSCMERRRFDACLLRGTHHLRQDDRQPARHGPVAERRGGAPCLCRPRDLDQHTGRLPRLHRRPRLRAPLCRRSPQDGRLWRRLDLAILG
mmetsp:Transcript_114854/g.331897  ORF Transcript_114854/g.331897 Transcript_114854/m.331897 type:complete len:216 (-) Transcript_114854:147-794(-)